MASTGQFNVVCTDKFGVQLHQRGVLGPFRRRIAADCLHFSISRIQLETQAALKVGQPVVMDVVVDGLRVDDLTGVVRSASAVEGKHYYDIDFRVDGTTRANALRCLRHVDTPVPKQMNRAGL
jgi:hypothetical protein